MCNLEADLTFGWSLRFELKPEVIFLPAFPPHLRQELQKWSVFSILACSFLVMVARKLKA
jgi:hypothetical protein